MNLLTYLMRMLGWPPPAVTVRVPTRKLRATCEFCGRDIAVARTTGRLYRHTCAVSDTHAKALPQDGRPS